MTFSHIQIVGNISTVLSDIEIVGTYFNIGNISTVFNDIHYPDSWKYSRAFNINRSVEIAPDRNNNYQSVLGINAANSQVRFKLKIPCAVLLEHYNTSTPHFVRYFMANLKQKTEHILSSIDPFYSNDRDYEFLFSSTLSITS